MHRKNVHLLSIFNFFIGFSLFTPLAIIYFSRISGSFALGTSVFGIIMLSSAIFEVPTGIWSDRIGRKNTIVLGSWARVIAFIFYALGFSYWWLIVGAIFEGISRAFYSGNNDAFLRDTLADDNMEKEFHEYQGRVSSTEQLAMGISALLGGIIANFSFTYLLWLSVLSQFVILYISYKFVEPRVRSNQDTNIFSNLKKAIRLFVTNKKLRLLSLASIWGYAISEIKWEFTSVFVATVWPIWAIGISRMLPSFGASLSFFFSGKIIKKYSEIKILLFDSILGKITSLIAFGIPNIFSPLFLSIPSVLYGVSSVAEKTLMHNEFTDNQRATMSSLNSLGGSIGFAVMSVFLGGLADIMGPAKALIILTLLSAPVIYLYWRLFSNDRRVAA